MTNNSYKTAITRTKPSAPMKYLSKHGLLKGKLLDYGCGKGFDAKHFGMAKYDPHFHPQKPKGKFDTITCNYVLNVLEPSDMDSIFLTIYRLLKKGGLAYFAVRRDVEGETFTLKGTYQRSVTLTGEDVTLITENKKFAIYSYRKV
jgi:ATP adenylyltransferase